MNGLWIARRSRGWYIGITHLESQEQDHISRSCPKKMVSSCLYLMTSITSISSRYLYNSNEAMSEKEQIPSVFHPFVPWARQAVPFTIL